MGTTSPILLLMAGSLIISATIGISVWPVPSHLSSGNGVLWIAEDLHFTYATTSNAVMFCSS